jgi:2'-5' RNA ligase
MPRTRTFIALELDKAIRERLVALQEELSRAAESVKWVEPENLHVTLLFLGEVDNREIPSVCRVISEGCSALSAFSLSVDAVGCFPNPRRPRTIWAGVGAGTQEVCALHDALERPLLDLGCYRREDRKYTPHITLGRVRSDRPTDRLAVALGKHAGWQGGQQTIREVHIMGSELTPDGPAYTVLGRGQLGKA